MAEKATIKKPMEPKAITPKKEDNYLVMQGDPEKQLDFGKKCATALMSVVANKKKKVIINGEQYLEFEDWQTLGRFFGITVGIEWTKVVEREGKIVGYEAKANVLRQAELISSAEAMCLRSEKNWANRDEFALRSMAQTRACAKALRNVLSWVAVLAGFKGTPAEEMDGVVNGKETTFEPIKEEGHYTCLNCKKGITEKVHNFSMSKFGNPFCMDCQKNQN